MILGCGQATVEASRGLDISEEAAAHRSRKKLAKEERRALMCKLESIREARRLGWTLWGKQR